MKKFKIVVLGSGPGGYVAAIKAAQHCDSVAIIEKGHLGGTCLNVGCIPTKTLIANASLLRKIQQAEDYGIKVEKVSFDFSKMTKRKDSVVGGLRQGIEGLIKANKITLLRGHGKFVGPNQIKVLGEDNEVIEAENAIIATGSEPRDIPAFPFDYEKVHSSTSILNLTKLPKKIIVVGGGVIGCEAASLYNILGVEVVILEMLPHLIAPEGEEMGRELEKALKAQGIDIRLGVAVEGIDTAGKGVTVRLKGHDSIEGDMALVAVGRKLNTDEIGLEEAGVVVDRGVIGVDEKLETNIPGIYAIGDVTAKWLLAHMASHQGMVAASNAAGLPAKIHYNAVPSVIFTHPEIATVGMTLEKAKAAGYDAKIGKFPFQALGKSQATLETEGFAQIVTERGTGRILGAQVMGHEAALLIAEIALAISNELTLESVSETIHAHPTIAEVWMEAALVANETPIHLPPKRKRK